MAVSRINWVLFHLVVINIIPEADSVVLSLPPLGDEVTSYLNDRNTLISESQEIVKNTSCPNSCKCNFNNSSNYEVNCERLGLSGIPKDIPLSTDSLLLSYNKIRRIQQRPFQTLTKLKYLSLANNNLSSIHVNAFYYLSNLDFLDLSGNNFSNGFPSSFDQLAKLTGLNLSRSEIHELPIRTFQNIANLTHLDLSHNHIYNLDSDYSSLVNIKVLDLSYNKLLIINNELNNCTSLTTLYLQGNKIKNIEPNAFESLKNLYELDLSFNNLEIVNGVFDGLSSLENLSLQNNHIIELCDETFKSLNKLGFLNLSGNYLTSLTGSPFAKNSRLTKLDLSRMLFLYSVGPNVFTGLSQLEELLLSNSPQLCNIHPDASQCLDQLQNLDISNCNLSRLEENFLSTMPNLQRLSLYGNDWKGLCDCSMQWLVHWQAKTHALEKALNENLTCLENFQTQLGYENLNCTSATVSSPTKYVMFKFGSSALLQCDVSGEPFPSITWVTPNFGNYRWYQSMVGIKTETSFSERCGGKTRKRSGDRIRVLDNGNLFIMDVQTADIGHYTCIVSNHLGSANTTISFLLDFKIINEVKFISMLVGLAVAVAFTFLSLLVQFIYTAINRWGLCCCCEGYVSPKTKQVRSILEGIEQYRSQQLERLRENYNSQVQRIKDNCTQQVEKIRDTYTADKIRDIRDYSTQHLSSIRDNYYDQVKKVRDYSVQQLNKVRENYIFQRNRVRKFSTHQMIKLRENYKIQQLHLNKILENLNLESCRTTCGRTDSILFNSDETLGPLLPDLFQNFPEASTSPQGLNGPQEKEDEAISRGSQYFTPGDNNSVCEGASPSEEVPVAIMTPSRTMADKCVGTLTFQLNEQPIQSDDSVLNENEKCANEFEVNSSPV